MKWDGMGWIARLFDTRVSNTMCAVPVALLLSWYSPVPCSHRLRYFFHGRMEGDGVSISSSEGIYGYVYGQKISASGKFSALLLYFYHYTKSRLREYLHMYGTHTLRVLSCTS